MVLLPRIIKLKQNLSEPTQPTQSAKAKVIGRPRQKAAHRMKTDAERHLFLRNDPWIVPGTVEKNKVQCAGCHKHLVIDKRRSFYFSLWKKHRERCKVIPEADRQAGIPPLPARGTNGMDLLAFVAAAAIPVKSRTLVEIDI